MDIDQFQEYHRDRIGMWRTQIDAYTEQLNSYGHFSDVDRADTEVEQLESQITDNLYEFLPEAQERAYDSFQALLEKEKKLENQWNHDHTYDGLPDSQEAQEQLYEGIQELKGMYHDITEAQEEAYEQTVDLFGPFPEKVPPKETNIPVTDNSTNRHSAETVELNSDTYWDRAKKAIDNPYVQNAGAALAVFGAAWLGNRIARGRNKDREKQKQVS